LLANGIIFVASIAGLVCLGPVFWGERGKFIWNRTSLRDRRCRQVKDK
jgi:hypothetical protein